MKARFHASLLALLILATDARPETITRDLAFERPVFAASGGEVVISIEGCRTIARPGAPMVPVYPAVFFLRPGEEIVSVSVSPLEKETVLLPGPVRPMPDQVSPGRKWSGAAGKDTSIYGSRDWWPRVAGELSSVQGRAGAGLAFIDVYPLRPSGSGGEALFTPSVRITIETRRGPSADGGPLPRSRLVAAGLPAVENPYDLEAFSAESETFPGSYHSASPVPYVIITSEALAEPFGQLASFREQHGLRVEIVTVESIDAGYEGPDRQARIREFIRHAWRDWQTEFVLLGGDVDVIPHRSLYVKAGTEVETDLPGDIYYSCLDGSWNTDGDAYFGEPGEEDLIPEVSVGRLPVDSGSDIDAFVSKLILYTETPPAGLSTRALMAGELLWSIDGIDTWGGDCKDEIISGSGDYGFSSAGIPHLFDVTTLYDRDVGTWSAGNIAPLLNAGVNLVNHLGHTNLFSVMRIPVSDLWRLDNVSSAGMPFVCYSQGCYPASFDNRDDAGVYYAEDCIGERLVTGAQGAVAFVGNTRLGWNAPGSTCGVSQFFDRQFFDALFGEGITEIGRALDDSRVDNIPFLSYAAVRYVMYGMCLIGDPAMSVWTREPAALSVTRPDSLVEGENSIEVSVAGDQGPVEGARVSVMSGGADIYHTEFTGPDGIARLFFSTGEAQDIMLIASAPGYFTSNVLLPVVEPAPALVEIGWLAVDDSGPDGDGDGLIESGETVRIDLIVSNMGDLVSGNTLVRLAAEDDYLRALVDIRSLGNMPPKTSAVMPAAFTVYVGEDAPDGHVASFDIEIESDLERKISRHTVALNAPGLSLDHLSLDDSVDGNANGCLEAWEFLVLRGGWTNNGSVDIVSPRVSVSCPAGGWARAVKHEVRLDDMPIGASVTLPPELEIFISEDAPPFSPVEIEITFEGDNIAPRTESLAFTTCGYGLEDPLDDASSCSHFSLTGYDGWRLSGDDFISAPVSWRCGGKDGQVYPNMTESYLVTPAVCLGENTTLTFWHRMEAEASAAYPYWARDASVVEISTDLGHTWQIITPAGNYPCRAASTNTIFLPAYARCFSGTIGWKQETFDLSAFRGPAMIRFHFASDEQYGFEGWYIDDITISTELTTDSGDPAGGTPQATRLLPAWPNPFNPATTIPFELSSEGLVEIRLYDVSGRLVRELSGGRFDAGVHSVRWDGRDGGGRPVSSGVYFCRMKTGVYRATSRLVLLR